jgi:hypothetical protein
MANEYNDKVMGKLDEFTAMNKEMTLDISTIKRENNEFNPDEVLSEGLNELNENNNMKWGEDKIQVSNALELGLRSETQQIFWKRMK